jgi:hypothetical protein
MIEKLKVLKLSLTSLTLVGAAGAALVSLFKAMGERAEAAAQALANIKGDNLRNEVTSTAEAYDKLKASMDEATAKGDAMLEYNQAMIDANKKLSLSINEISKQRELSSAKDDDERLLIENKYKGKADEISGMSEREKENASMQRSIELEQETDRKIQEAEERKREATQQAEKASKQAQNASSTGRGKIGFWSSLVGVDRFSQWNGIAKSAGESTSKAIGEYGEADADLQRLTSQKEAIRKNREVFQKNRMAGANERTAASMATGREASDIKTGIATKTSKEELQSKIDSSEAEMSSIEERFGAKKVSLSGRASREKQEETEARNVLAAYRKKGDKKGIARAEQAVIKESAEAEEAAKALEALGQEAARVINGIKMQVKAMQEQMKRIGQ